MANLDGLTVVFVPGFTGSNLYDATNPDLHWIWPDMGQLALGRQGRLRLASNGVDPGGTDGRRMIPIGIVDSYYQPALTYLEQQLKDQFYGRLVRFAYDWRLSSDMTGPSLANRVRAEYLPGLPVTIVAHSMGGLVSRVAWSDLVATNEQHKLRRIITLGTSHRGGWASIRTMAKGEDEINDWIFLTRLADLSRDVSFGTLDARSWTAEEIQELFMSFPSLIELFPQPDIPESEYSPDLLALWDGSAWPDRFDINRTRLQFVRRFRVPFFKSPQSFPPSHVMTTVGGSSRRTPDGIRLDGQLAKDTPFTMTANGDTFVTLDSALLPGSEQYELESDHPSLPLIPALNGDLLKWIVAERDPSSPPPPAQRAQGATVAVLLAPPIGGPVRVPQLSKRLSKH